MSDTADSIRIEVELALDAADRAYDEKVKKWTTPVKIPFVDANSTATGRTFGGDRGSPGTLSVPSTSNVAPVGQSVDLQRLIVARTIGGTGFSPATMPVATAGLNSVYGELHAPLSALGGASAALPLSSPPASAPMGASASGGNGYRGYFRSALRSGIRNPFTEEAYNASGGWQAAMYEQDAWREQKTINKAMGRMVGPSLGPSQDGVDDFTRSMLPGGSNAGPGGSPSMRRAGLLSLRAGAGGGAIGAFARRQMTTFPTLGGQLGSVFGAYGAINSVGSFFEGQNAFAMGQAQNLGNYAGAAQAAIANDPTRGFVEGIPLFGGVASAIAEYQTGGRAAAARTMGMAAIQDRITQATRSQVLGLKTATLGAGVARESLVGGFNGKIAAFDAQLVLIEPNRQAAYASETAPFQEKLTAANQTIARFAGQSQLKDGDYREYKSAQADRASATDELARAQARSMATAEQQRRTAEAGRALTIQEDYALARSTRLGTSLSTRGAGLTLSGNSFAGTLAGIDAQFDPIIDETSNAIGRGSACQSDYARRDAATAGRLNARRAAGRERLDNLGDIAGGFAENAGALAFDPYGGRRRGTNARFGARLAGLDPNSEDAGILRGQQAQENALNDQAQNLFNIDVGRENRFTGKSLDRLLANDPIGARAYQLANAGAAHIQGLARAGATPEAIADAKTNVFKQFDVDERQYGLSFRAVEVDARYQSFRGVRDSENVSDAFRAMDDARKQFDKTDPNEGKVDGKGGFDYDKFEKATEDAMTRALQAAMTN